MAPLMSYLLPLAGLLPSLISAHGHLEAITADGIRYPGFNFTDAPGRDAAGWTTASYYTVDWSVDPPAYNTPDIICHKSATNAKLSVAAKPGSKVTFKWNDWPYGSHPGPIIFYVANCNGDCTTVNKTSLKWVKFDATGMKAGKWATDIFFDAATTWNITIPNFAPGNYIIREELISLYRASRKGGAENYPQCVNFKISGSGTEQVTGGVLGTELYKDTDPGILIDIGSMKGTEYPMPGPPLQKFTYP